MLVHFLGFLLVFPFMVQAFESQENFVFLDGTTGEVLYEEGPTVEVRATPACSFNIVLSLIGFDTGILVDETHPVWPYEEGYVTSFDSWKQPQTPLLWMRTSCFWFSQQLGSSIGIDRMDRYVTLFAYGNQDVSGGATRAWVSSSLKISPKEQAAFVLKLTQGVLPVSEGAVIMTRKLLYREELPYGGALYGKTGMGSTLGPKGEKLFVRSFVGWVEKEGLPYPFAYTLIAEKLDWQVTVSRVKELIARLCI